MERDSNHVSHGLDLSLHLARVRKLDLDSRLPAQIVILDLLDRSYLGMVDSPPLQPTNFMERLCPLLALSEASTCPWRIHFHHS